MILKRAADLIESFYTSTQQNMAYLPSPTPQSMMQRQMSQSSFQSIPTPGYYTYPPGSALQMGGYDRPPQMRPEIMVTDALMEGNDEVFDGDIEVISLLFPKNIHDDEISHLSVNISLQNYVWLRKD